PHTSHTPYSLLPTPYSLLPTPYSLLPTLPTPHSLLPSQLSIDIFFYGKSIYFLSLTVEYNN
ncbi:hypothetical protein PN490_06625, partial [Nodularia spumigena CS-588/01]|nr:hypothetical protein [Nodularia spumigena CS-588/01]